MSTVLDALKKAQEGSGRGAGGGFSEEPPPGRRKRGPRLFWVLLGIFALAVAFAGGLELSGGGSEEASEEVASVDPGVAGGGEVEVREVVAVAPVPPPEVAVEPADPPAAPPVAKIEVAPREVKPVVADQSATGETRPAAEREPQMSEKRRRALERVLARREDREKRRDKRLAQRQETQGIRDAIRAAETPEERESLLEEFRERRAIARAERRAAAAEKRLSRAEERVSVETSDDPRAEMGRRGIEIGPPPGRRAAEPPPPPPPAAPVVAPAPLPAPPAVVAASALRRDEGLRRPPTGAPKVRINILQYSDDPGRRFAYLSVEGNPAMSQVREGESYQGLTVTRIYPETVEFAHQGTTFLLRAN